MIPSQDVFLYPLPWHPSLFCPVSTCVPFLYPSHSLSPQPFHGRAFQLHDNQRQPRRGDGANLKKVQPTYTQEVVEGESVFTDVFKDPGEQGRKACKTFFYYEMFQETHGE